MSATEMTTERGWAGTSAQTLTAILVAFALLHLLLTFALPDVEARFMLGDRAQDRLDKLRSLLAAKSLSEALVTLIVQGSPGDYALLAPAYTLGGAFGVMLQSLALYLVALACLFHLVRGEFGQTTAIAATVIYSLLPATIFHPQALVSETISNPLIIIAAYLVMRAVRSANLIRLGAAMGLVSVVVFTRHAYLLLPLLAGLFILFVWPRRESRRLATVAAVALGYTVPVVWSLVVLVTPVETERASAGGLGANLQARAERVALIAGVAAPESHLEARREGVEGTTRSITPGQFLAFVASHPVAYVKSTVSDAFNILVNPGVAMVAGRYLRLFDLDEHSEEDLSRWRKIRDEHGPLAVARELWRTSPTALILNAAGLVVWGGLLGLAAAGAWMTWRDGRTDGVLLVLLVGLVIYVVAFNSLVAGYTRWDHRSGGEFAIAILAALSRHLWLRQRMPA